MGGGDAGWKRERVAAADHERVGIGWTGYIGLGGHVGKVGKGFFF